MIRLGEMQELEMIKSTDFGIYLKEAEASPDERILLPKAQVPKDLKIGDSLQVFVYKDSDDRPIATTLTPKVILNQVALLQVKEVTTIGAFLDWGLAKDLLLPFKEQTERVHTGEYVLAALYIDKSTRLCGTMKIYEYLKKDSTYKKGDKVIGTVYEISRNFGAFVAVDNCFSALIPQKELKRNIKVGDSVEARVTSVKEDGKLDLSLQEEIPVQIDSDAQIVFRLLQEADGFLPYHDKTDPEIIAEKFGLSKNAYKRAIGRLMKEQKIRITPEGIEEIKTTV